MYIPIKLRSLLGHSDKMSGLVMSQTSGEHTSVVTDVVDLNIFWWVVPMSEISYWMWVAQEEPPAPECLSLQALHLVRLKAFHNLSVFVLCRRSCRKHSSSEEYIEIASLLPSTFSIKCHRLSQDNFQIST